MLSHSFYETDNRVIRYAEALVSRGDSVDVIALRRSPEMLSEETICGVKVHRIQDRFGKDEQSIVSYTWPLIRFLIVSSLCIRRLGKTESFALIHVHNFPDFVVLAVGHARRRGAKVILDVHDIMPELVLSKFGRIKGNLLLPGARMLEKLSARLADRIILASDLWLQKYTRRAAALGKCSVFINNVDERLFYRRKRKRSDRRKVVIFPGGLQWHQGVDIAIRAFQIVQARLPEAEFHIYGEGSAKPDLVRLVDEMELGESVHFLKPVGITEIAELIADADLGVVPKRANSFGEEAYSTKILEFMASGVPVVVSSTAVDRYYFNDSVVRFFESENVGEMAEAMVVLLTDRAVRRKMIRAGAEYAQRNNWAGAKDRYLKLIDSLCATPLSEGTGQPRVQIKSQE